MDDGLGRVLREWILFAVGVGLVIVLAVNWVKTGAQPNAVLAGIALILLGYGHLILRYMGRGE